MGDLLLAKAQQVFVTLELELSFALLLLFAFDLLLELLLLVFELVLHAFDVQLQLLLDLNMISNFRLVFLKHGLVLARRFIAAHDTFTLVSWLISLRIIITLWPSFLLTRCVLIRLFELLLLFHFHVH